MRRLSLCLIIVAALGAEARAHFLWVVANPAGKTKEVHAYFGESAAPDDPALLEKFKDLKIVAVERGRDGKKLHEISLKPVEDALTGALSSETSAPLVAQQTYGVVSRGGESFLLKYYAKTYASVLPGGWNAVADAELAALEITPRCDGQDLVLQVTWQGKPVAGDQVTVEGPSLAEKIQGETDAEGQFRCRIPAKGLLSIRARHSENTEGKLGEQSYASVRHYATLALPYAPSKMTTVEQALPELPKGITSFGAAIVGQDLYVYGGHFGQAHHYSTEGQSNEFLRLKLNDSGAGWETLPSGPKLTGTSLVSHNGKLFRLGGFMAKNVEKDSQDLWSQDGFSQFDPAAGQWTDLPSLPEPRSSHDSAVLDGKLYVVGGWNMAGSDNTAWHDTAWVCDLSQSELTWSALPATPFHRRALSVAAYQGKLYILGGMQESGGPTTRVDIYDPDQRTWLEGPSLQGNGMEGFGNSSFAIGKHLIATTISGSAQQLSADGQSWEIIGQLTYPRFFHRQLPTAQGELLVVGGASMQTGKTKSLEVFRAAE